MVAETAIHVLVLPVYIRRNRPPRRHRASGWIQGDAVKSRQLDRRAAAELGSIAIGAAQASGDQ
jgi:hypothetical protein